MIQRPFQILGGFLNLFRIVPVDEAHVRVMYDRKEVFMSRVGYRPSYWFVPFVTRIVKIPLSNITINVPDVKLNDKNMAKFVTDIACFVNIKDPIKAAERTGLTVEQIKYEGRAIGIDNLNSDFRQIVQGIIRTASTQQTILEIYQSRKQLSDAVAKDVASVFPEWGLELVNLEIVHLRDDENSTIISDIEAKQAAQINADSRVKTAEEKKRAEIAEAQNKRDAELVKAQTEEEYRKRQIEKDKNLAVQEELKRQAEAEQARIANEKIVEARRKLEVGQASVEKEATVERAEAQKSELEIVAKGQAEKIKLTGAAEADIIKAKKLADAEGTEKQALAQQKYNDAATNIEKIKANVQIEEAWAKANGEIGKNAHINIVKGESKSIVRGGLLGDVKVGAEEGVALSQFLEQNPQLKSLAEKFGISGKDQKSGKKK